MVANSLSETRYGAAFGYGQPPVDKNYTYGWAWSDGCPVPSKFIQKIGQLRAKSRYTELCQAFCAVAKIVSSISPNLSKDLSIPDIRLCTETKYLKYEEENVPKNHRLVISPMGKLTGWALARLLAQPDRLELSTDAACHSQNSLEFLARLAEKSFENCGDPFFILSIMFSSSYLEEQRTYHTFDRLYAIMPEVAPNLFDIYHHLDAKVKSDLQITEFNHRFTCRPDNY